MAARSWPTSACSASLRAPSESGSRHSVRSMQTPSTDMTEPPGSSIGSPVRTTVRSHPSARTMRVSRAKDRPFAQAAETAARTRPRSSARW
jgi:hypothetical protein